MNLTAMLIAALMLVLGLAVGGVWVHHSGYVAGENDKTAQFAPLFAAANAAKFAADARAEIAEKGAAAISRQSGKDHELFAHVLADRVAAANDRIAGILRQRAAADRAARRCQLPGIPGPTDVAGGTAASDQRDAELARRLSNVGGQCEHDAAEVAGFHKWIAEQRANAQAVIP